MTSPREIGQRARELLAAEVAPSKRRFILSDTPSYAGPISTGAALRAIEAALRSTGGEDPRIAAVRRVIEFGYQHCVDGRPVNPLKNGERCSHGRIETEDCIGCYDEALLNALSDTGERE